MRFSFKVQGSEAQPYIVVFERSADAVFTSCTCAAGEKQQACKHRLSLIAGETANIVSDNQAEALKIAPLIEGTTLAIALSRLKAAELALEEAKRLVAIEKRSLSRVMHR